MKTKNNNKIWLFTLIIFAVIVISACLCVGLTYAYFSNRGETSDTITLASLKLDGVTTSDGSEWALPETPIEPNQNIISSNLKAQVKSNIPYYTRILVGATIIPVEGSVHATKNETDCVDYVDEDIELLDIKIGDSIEDGIISGETFKKAEGTNINEEYVYYNLNPIEAPSSLEQAQDVNFAISIDLKSSVGDDYCTYYMEAKLSISVAVEVIQANFLEDVIEGDAFTDVNEMNTTWEKLAPRKVTYDLSFGESTWKKIDKIAKTGRANEVFNVGDTKTFTLTTGEEVTMVILGFNHDELSDESGNKAGITLGMKDMLSTTNYKMNSSQTNVGGWENSSMRKSTMEDLYYRLPKDIRAVVKEVNKNTTSGNKSTNIITSKDKLWLLSVAEVHSEIAIRRSGTYMSYVETLKLEGEQYEYYANLIGDADPHGTKNELIKRYNNGTGSSGYWWLRSPRLDDARYFFRVNLYGACNDYQGYADSGISFCFCI